MVYLFFIVNNKTLQIHIKILFFNYSNLYILDTLIPLSITYSKAAFNCNKLFKINEKYEKQTNMKNLFIEQNLRSKKIVQLKKYNEKYFWKYKIYF